MSNNRDFISLRPLGTNVLLRSLPAPTLRRYRARWTFLAEVTRGSDAETLLWWSWLVQHRQTGKYMALGTDHGTSALPQRKVVAALANLAHARPDSIERARDDGFDPGNEGANKHCAQQDSACARWARTAGTRRQQLS